MNKLILVTLIIISTPLMAQQNNICNTEAARRMMIDNFNNLEDRDTLILDAYNFKTISFDKAKGTLVCVGTIENDYGEKIKIRYSERRNSMGDSIYEFEPLD